MQIEVTKLVKRGISINELLSHSALDLIFSKATNFASLVDLVMHVCLDDFQETALPASVNTYSLVGFTSFISKIKLLLQYPFKTVG